MLSLGSGAVLNYFESRPQIDAFFKDKVGQEQIDDLEKRLIDTGRISKIKFISKDEALKIYKERNKDDPSLTELVTAEILPPSFQISTKAVTDQATIASTLEGEDIVDKVIFREDLVKTLTSWTNAIRNGGLVMVIFLIITSVLITLIVISLNISLHKDEIETMRLVGATEGYIRTPFVLEGVFYGFIAAFFATFVVWLGIYWLTPFLQKFLSDVPIFPIDQMIFVYLLLGEITAGIVIGALGSYIATRKYLRV